MKRNVLIFGAISGLISTLWMMVIVMNFDPSKMENMDSGMWYGYAAMLVANIFIIVGVKNYRDKQQNGVITFGKAFKVGFLIALVASTMYVVTWLIYYYASGTDFIEQWSGCLQRDLEAKGATPAELAQHAQEMKDFARMYQNPFFNALVTYSEILPLGIVFALLTAIIMRRKRPVNPSLDADIDGRS